MKRTRMLAVALLLAGVAGGSVWAQSSEDRAGRVNEGSGAAAVTDPRSAADFGTGTNILQIPAAAFNVRSGSAPAYQGLGYVQFAGAHDLWAPVWLPSGASIQWLDIYTCDTNAGASITFFLTRYTGYNDGNRATDDITSISSVDGAGSGCRYDFNLLNPAHIVNNDVRYGGGGQYVINAQASAAGLQFKAVDLWWSRPISPAPATASFIDVPTTHGFFQVIEALKASGITAGCTANQFCPDAPVTRAAMAAFLARALGLYWPY